MRIRAAGWLLVVLSMTGCETPVASDGGLKKPVVVGHRGAGGKFPENTMVALKHGWGSGAAFCEVDVRSTQDGVLVLMHDETVERTTDGEGELARMTFAGVQRLDAGAAKGGWFKGQGVPTLEEVLTAARRVGGGLVLHLKEPSTFRQVRELLATTGMKPERTVLLFDGKNVAAGVKVFGKLAYPMWSTVSTPPLEVGAAAYDYYRRAGISALSFFYHRRNPVPAEVEKVQAEGFRFAMYATSGGADVIANGERGVDLYLTDFPERVTGLLRKRRGGG